MLSPPYTMQLIGVQVSPLLIKMSMCGVHSPRWPPVIPREKSAACRSLDQEETGFAWQQSGNYGHTKSWRPLLAVERRGREEPRGGSNCAVAPTLHTWTPAIVQVPPRLEPPRTLSTLTLHLPDSIVCEAINSRGNYQLLRLLFRADIRRQTILRDRLGENAG